MDPVAREILEPARLWSRDEVLSRPSPVPASPGLYGWYFRQPPPGVDASRCFSSGEFVLLYAGISLRSPLAHGLIRPTQTLRSRIRTHMHGNAEGSTLRLTLGCLLSETLGMELRRVGNGRRFTFSRGEAVLSDWMGQNARVCWAETLTPWLAESRLIQSVPLPLNLAQNADHPFHESLNRLRREARERARQLPVLPR